MPLVTRVRRATADRRTNGPASSNIHVQHGRWGRAKASAPAGKRPNISRPKGRPRQYPRLPTSFLLSEEQPLLPLSSQLVIPAAGDHYPRSWRRQGRQAIAPLHAQASRHTGARTLRCRCAAQEVPKLPPRRRQPGIKRDSLVKRGNNGTGKRLSGSIG